MSKAYRRKAASDLTQEQADLRARMVESAFRSGQSKKDVAKSLGISSKVVDEVLKERGLTLDSVRLRIRGEEKAYGPSLKTQRRNKELETLYLRGVGERELAERYKIQEGLVRSVLVSAGLLKSVVEPAPWLSENAGRSDAVRMASAAVEAALFRRAEAPEEIAKRWQEGVSVGAPGRVICMGSA